MSKPRVTVRHLFSGEAICCVSHPSGRTLWARGATDDEALRKLRAKWQRTESSGGPATPVGATQAGEPVGASG